jgi:hypothetical protein
MTLLIELIAILAILNATIGEQQIPVEVTTRLAPTGDEPVIASGSEAASAEEPAPAAQALPLGLDAALITTMAGVAGGAFAAFKKSAGRDNAIADTQLKAVDSLKATDYGVKDTAMANAEHANIVTEALAQLEGLPEETKTRLQKSNQKIQENARQWCADVADYYEHLPTAPRPGELEKDKVKTKLAQVNKITEPTSDPS